MDYLANTSLLGALFICISSGTHGFVCRSAKPSIQGHSFPFFIYTITYRPKSSPRCQYHPLSDNSYQLRFTLLIFICFQKDKGTWFWKRRLFSLRENCSLFGCSLFWKSLGWLIFAIIIPQGAITQGHTH